MSPGTRNNEGYNVPPPREPQFPPLELLERADPEPPAAAPPTPRATEPVERIRGLELERVAVQKHLESIEKELVKLRLRVAEESDKRQTKFGLLEVD